MLMTGGVHLQRGLAVEPNAAAALIGVAVAADGGVIQPVELTVGHVGAAVKVAHAVGLIVIVGKCEAKTYNRIFCG